MEAKYVIADSGGSSTAWGIVLKNNEVIYLQTGSLHPKYALSNAFSSVEIKKELRDLHVPLYFYGAGCAAESVQEKMRVFLSEFGFSEIHVYPDTLGACRAIYGNRSGWLGVLGTGSILVRYDGADITDRIGGYGSLVGDEGSGFYFGKLLVRFLLRNTSWEKEWMDLFRSGEYLLSRLAGSDAQQWISGLGRETATMNLGFLHEKNAVLFVERYCLSAPDLKKISIVGTYGYEQQQTFREVLQRHDIQLERVVSGPITDLVSYHCVNE